MLRLVGAQRLPIIGAVATRALSVLGVEIPKRVVMGEDLNLVHRGHGVVLHPQTNLGRHVTLYHNVTVARSNSWVQDPGSVHTRVKIGDHSVLCPGSVVLFSTEDLTVGEGTVLGANSVLLTSTGDWEIWAGAPARCVGRRRDRPAKFDSQ